MNRLIAAAFLSALLGSIAPAPAQGPPSLYCPKPPLCATDSRWTPEEDEYEVMRILTAECGRDAELCFGVAQALRNASEKEGVTPLEATVLYQYTDPTEGWISEEARMAYESVFIEGTLYGPVEDALYFYAPRYCESEWHESMRFICEINGVRFFGDHS